MEPDQKQHWEGRWRVKTQPYKLLPAARTEQGFKALCSTSKAMTEQPSERDCSSISFDLILQWMQPCFSTVEKFLIFKFTCSLCSLKNENTLLAGK